MTKDEIAELVIAEVADVFSLDKNYVAEHPDLNFRTDLGATSLQYFPLITELEEKLDIEMESHAFQSKAATVEAAIQYVTSLVMA